MSLAGLTYLLVTIILVGVVTVGVATAGGTLLRWDGFRSSVSAGCCLSGRLSGNAVVEGVFLHVVGPGGRRHAAVRIQQDPEAAHDQEAQEDEEDEEEDKGRPLLQGEEGGGRGGGGGGEVWVRRREGAAVDVLCHDGRTAAG